MVFSLKKSGRLEYISLAFAQSSDATNGCGVIQPVVALEHTILGGDLILEDTVSVATQHLNEIRGAGDQRFVGLFETTDCLSKLGRYKDVNFGGYLVGDLSCNDFMNNMLSSIPSAVHCGFGEWLIYIILAGCILLIALMKPRMFPFFLKLFCLGGMLFLSW